MNLQLITDNSNRLINSSLCELEERKVAVGSKKKKTLKWAQYFYFLYIIVSLIKNVGIYLPT